jgi:hypothetical protein
MKIIPIDQSSSIQTMASTTSKQLATTTVMISKSYDAPVVLTQPTDHQRMRMFSELAKGICPIIQAGGEDASQRTYVEVQVNNNILILR